MMNMASRKSKSSKSIEKLGIDSIQVQDDLELTKHGLFANHCDGRIKVENVLDVLYDLEESEQILRTLIYQIRKEASINKRLISGLESGLESTENDIVNLNIPSESGNLIASDKNDWNEYPK